MEYYRVVPNFALSHLQWIVVRDEKPGRPILVAGPFQDERAATLHCDAMNERRRMHPLNKSWAARIHADVVRCWPLLKAGWPGIVFHQYFPPNPRLQ